MHVKVAISGSMHLARPIFAINRCRLNPRHRVQCRFYSVLLRIDWEVVGYYSPRRLLSNDDICIGQLESKIISYEHLHWLGEEFTSIKSVRQYLLNRSLRGDKMPQMNLIK